MEISKFTIRKPENQEYEDILEFIHNDYRKRELLSVLTMPETDKENLETKQLMNDRYLRWLLDGVSLIAIEEATKTIVGIAINCIVEKSDQLHEDKVPAYLLPAIQFIDKLENSYNVFEELHTDNGIDLRFLGVKESHSKRGIAKKLAEETLVLAKELNFKFVHSISTNPITLHLFDKLGFEIKSEMKCVDFYKDDASPGFPKAQPTNVVRYMVKIL